MGAVNFPIHLLVRDMLNYKTLYLPFDCPRISIVLHNVPSTDTLRGIDAISSFKYVKRAVPHSRIVPDYSLDPWIPPLCPDDQLLWMRSGGDVIQNIL